MQETPPVAAQEAFKQRKRDETREQGTHADEDDAEVKDEDIYKPKIKKKKKKTWKKSFVMQGMLYR